MLRSSVNPSLVGFGWGPPAGRTVNSSILGGAGQDEATARILSILRTPVRDAPPARHTNPFDAGHGTEVQRMVMSQQVQLDSLVDKVAVVLANMHAELQQDASSAAKADEVERKLGRVEMRFGEFNENQAELRCWLHGRVDALSGHLASEVDSMQLHLSKDACGLHERLAAMEGEIYGNDEDVTPKWKLAVDRACAVLRQEMRVSVLDGHAEARIEALEQLQRQVGGAGQLDELRAQLQQAETAVRRQGSALEHLMGDVRQLKQTSMTHEESLLRLRNFESNEGTREAAADRDRDKGATDRSTLIEPLRSRMGVADQRLDAMQERIESLSTTLQQVRCSVANGVEASDQRLKAATERADSLTASVQEMQRQIPAQLQKVLGSMQVEQRLDEMYSQIKAMDEAMMEQESRNIEQQFSRLEGPLPDCEELMGRERIGIRSKPPLPGSRGTTASPASGSLKEQRFLAETELPQMLEAFARQLEVVDELMQRVDVVEEHIAAGDLALPDAELSPDQTSLCFSQTLGFSEAQQDHSADFKGRLATVEQSLEALQDAGREPKDRTAHDLKSRLVSLEQSLEALQDVSSQQKGTHSKDLSMVVERIREIEKSALQNSSSKGQLAAAQLAHASKTDLTVMSQRMEEVEQALGGITDQLQKVQTVSVAIETIIPRLDTLEKDFESLGGADFCRMKDDLQEFDKTADDQAAELANVALLAKRTEQMVITLGQTLDAALAGQGSASEGEDSYDSALGRRGMPRPAGSSQASATPPRIASARSARSARSGRSLNSLRSGSARRMRQSAERELMSAERELQRSPARSVEEANDQEESIGCSTAKVVLCRFQVAEEGVAKLLHEFPRTPSARGRGTSMALDAENCLRKVREQAELILAPVAAGAGALNEGENAWVPPTLELRGRVEELLRGKLMSKLLARRLRRLLNSEADHELAPRLAEAEETLLALRLQLRGCLDDAMGELRRQVNELVPPTSDEDESPR